MAYLFSHEEKKERERLAAIEAMGDPFTIECLEKIGVGERWRCLEIGAGGGSIAEWLCGRVGPSGKVVATDLQTKFLEAIEASNLEVRKHDITQGDLEHETFDLVSARKVLEHLPKKVDWNAAGDQGIGKVYRMTFERLRERVTKAGLLTTEEVDQFLADIQSPEFGAVTGFHCAAWGRKPAE